MANSCLLKVEQDRGKDAAGTLRLTTAMHMFDLQGRPAWRLQELITTVYCVSELVLSPCRCRCRHPSGLTVGWPSTPARDVFLFTAGSLANTGPGNGADEAQPPSLVSRSATSRLSAFRLSPHLRALLFDNYILIITCGWIGRAGLNSEQGRQKATRHQQQQRALFLFGQSS